MFISKKWNSNEFAINGNGATPVDNFKKRNLYYELDEVGDGVKNDRDEDNMKDDYYELCLNDFIDSRARLFLFMFWFYVLSKT